ncbi:MAG: hypothetical protein NT018_11835 [Armatimonadetes bacterium]|nr:hypothetical protein [Armatimonadota bacterium]
MKSAVLCRREIFRRKNRGSTLAAALALVFLVFAITTVSLTRIACTSTQISMRHRQTTALFLAEAGIRKAGQQLSVNSKYSGETGTALPTGTFDIKVKAEANGYMVTSTGIAKSGIKTGQKRTVRALVNVIRPGLFKIKKWVDNP